MARKQNISLGHMDPLPEADRLEGFAHPREASKLFGHETAEGQFLEAFRSGQLHHAWLLSGSEGVGKATFAYMAAKFLFCATNGIEGGDPESLEPVPDNLVSHMVNAQSHPNLLVIRRPWVQKTKRFSSIIPVDEVRRLNNFFGMTAGDDGWRVVIIDSADDLNLHSANALLKSLEEPPERCLFLLISSQPGRLLPTIRSRCRTLQFDSLEQDNLTQAVQNAFQLKDEGGEPGDGLDRIICLADGSVRRTLELLSGNGLDLYEKIIKIIADFPKFNGTAADELAERLSPVGAAAEFEVFFSLLSAVLRRLIRSRAGMSSPMNQENMISEKVIPVSTLAHWAELWETLNRAKAEAQALNLDRRLFILECFQKLHAAALMGAGSNP